MCLHMYVYIYLYIYIYVYIYIYTSTHRERERERDLRIMNEKYRHVMCIIPKESHEVESQTQICRARRLGARARPRTEPRRPCCRKHPRKQTQQQQQ